MRRLRRVTEFTGLGRTEAWREPLEQHFDRGSEARHARSEIFLACCQPREVVSLFGREAGRRGWPVDVRNCTNWHGGTRASRAEERVSCWRAWWRTAVHRVVGVRLMSHRVSLREGGERAVSKKRRRCNHLTRCVRECVSPRLSRVDAVREACARSVRTHRTLSWTRHGTTRTRLRRRAPETIRRLCWTELAIRQMLACSTIWRSRQIASSMRFHF